MSPEVILDGQVEREHDDALQEQCEHIAADDVPVERVLKVVLAEDGERVGDDLVARHVDESAAEAVLREDEEDDTQDRVDVAQLLVLTTSTHVQRMCWCMFCTYTHMYNYVMCMYMYERTCRYMHVYNRANKPQG